MMKKILLSAALLPMAAVAQIQTSAGVQYLQCQAKDMSGEFSDLSNTYFLADSLAGFDLNKGEGLLNWKRYRLVPRQAFNLNGYWPVRMKMLDFPDTQYDNDPNLRIKVQKIDNRTLRVTIFTSPIEPKMSISQVASKPPENTLLCMVLPLPAIAEVLGPCSSLTPESDASTCGRKVAYDPTSCQRAAVRRSCAIRKEMLFETASQTSLERTGSSKRFHQRRIVSALTKTRRSSAASATANSPVLVFVG